MKPVLIVLAVFFSMPIFSQYEWPPKGVEGVDYHINSKDKSDGLHYRTYSTGELFYIGYFEKGKPKPNTEFWYYYEKPEGHPMSKHNILDSPNSIDATNYFTDGQVMSKGHYENQLKNGIWKFYSENGTLTSSETFKDDVLHGEMKVYYPNNQVFRIENYTDGNKDGAIIEYFEKGKKKLEGTFLNGVRDGEITYYLPSGRFDIIGNFKNGKKDGQWVKFNSKGQAELTTLYKNDVKTKERRDNGVFMDYYANGIPMSEYSYENAKKDGPFTEWYDMGEWIKEEVKMESTGQYGYKEKLIGTQISSQGDYLDDLLEGELTYYDENGRITKIETYSEGNLISTEEK